jgi:hypothetical protein
MFNSVTVGEAGATMRTMVPGPPGRLDQYTSSFTCTTFFFAQSKVPTSAGKSRSRSCPTRRRGTRPACPLLRTSRSSRASGLRRRPRRGWPKWSGTCAPKPPGWWRTPTIVIASCFPPGRCRPRRQSDGSSGFGAQHRTTDLFRQGTRDAMLPPDQRGHHRRSQSTPDVNAFPTQTRRPSFALSRNERPAATAGTLAAGLPNLGQISTRRA